MNIQPLGSTGVARYEERIASTAESGAANAASSRPAASAKPEETGAAAATPPSREELVDAVDKINQSMPPASQSLEFSIDENSKQTVVKVVDVTTREVVRQMPSEEALQIAKALDQALGKLIKETA